MKTAYFDCYSGISGNMALGAALDAGAGQRRLREILAGLKLKNFSISVKKQKRGSLQGTYVEVKDLTRNPPARNLSDIERLIRNANIHPDIKDQSIKVFQRLAKAEARVHKKPVSKIHFHEVGALDAIVDVVGTIAALWLLKIEQVYSSPLPLGTGQVECAHGMLPLPAPATLELLKGVPVTGDESGMETVTPTGAALITSLAENFGPLPGMRLEKIGYGLGTRDIPSRPNLLRMIIGQILTANQAVIQIEANLDDMSPEYYEFLFENLLNARALDVSLIPVQMKKCRPGVLVNVLSEKKDYHELINILLNHSSTLGVRYHEVLRTRVLRKTETYNTKFGKLRAKRAFRPDGTETLHPEYDDLKKAARLFKVSLKRVENEFRKASEKNSTHHKKIR